MPDVLMVDKHKRPITAALWALHKFFKSDDELHDDLEHAGDRHVRDLHRILHETADGFETGWHKRTLLQIGHVALWAGTYDTAWRQPFQAFLHRVGGAFAYDLRGVPDPHPKTWYANLQARRPNGHAFHYAEEFEAFMAENLKKREAQEPR